MNYDPLAYSRDGMTLTFRDVANCKLNIPYMQQLGLNAIRVYSVDNAAYHLFSEGYD